MLGIDYSYMFCVLYVGHVSKNVIIQSGCHQGGPNASYIFTLYIEILALEIRQNSRIKGLKINQKEHKLLQFADDTTVILNGTEESLGEPLKEITLYGNISGLKINVGKTQVTWIYI